MAKVNPISPDKARELHSDSMNPIVIAIVNDYLVKKFNNGKIVIKQNDLLEKIRSSYEALNKKYEESEIISDLDIEHCYRALGWEVTYHSSSYGEEYFEPYWIFKAK